MIIGVPKEIKNSENRVGMSPAGIAELVKLGHTVLVQSTAGENSGFTDTDYKEAGAKMMKDITTVYKSAEMIVKVKEPIKAEYTLIRENQLLFTYFHFASDEILTKAMIKNRAVCLAYETVEKSDRSLPLLIPMSEVAGRMATQQGAKFLEKPMKGRGILLGGVPGVKPAKVLILGGGIVGTHAAKMAAGLGANVTIMDVSIPRLRQLNEFMPANVTTVVSNYYNICAAIKQADLIIGAVLIPGAKAPRLITRDMLKMMRKGTVIIDVAVDQGGCIETCRPTTHQNPTYIIDDVVHYCVSNMPGAVPYTSTIALTNATLPYVIQLAEKGWKKACRDNNELKMGLNIIHGSVVYPRVAETFGYKTQDVNSFLN